MTPEQELQFEKLIKDVQYLMDMESKDNFSDLKIFRKKVEFKNDVTFANDMSFGGEVTFEDKVGFYGTTPVAQQSSVTTPSGGATIDTQARSSIGEIKIILDNYGLTA
ncbi:MAG: hypothetical protein GY861_18340 [bacterium]|nr:hypothetical protein [bacterium]